MPRVIKHPSVRKSEVLAAARALFFEHGYDNTSIEQVIGRAGVSKGGFYHHFPSKDALLEGLAETIAAESLEAIRNLLSDETLNAFERLDRFLAGGRQLKIAQAPQILSMFEAMFRPENLALYYRVHHAVSAVMAPVIAQILEQGRSEGTFRINDPEAVADMVLALAAVSHDAVARLLDARTEQDLTRAIDAFERRMVAQSIAVDRLLGLPDGSVRFIEPGFTEALMASRRLPAS